MTARIASGLCGLFLLLFWGAPSPALAETFNYTQWVGNIVIHVGVMPARMLRHYPRGSPESGMHGGPVASHGEYHVVVALFDARTNARISKAEVKAYVHEIGVGGVEKTLMPMSIAGTVTWGNYFPMTRSAPCHIVVTIRLPGSPRPIEALFTHWNA